MALSPPRPPAPALAQIEETALRWLASIMGYPETAGGILTSGGSLSTLSAIVAAREAKLPDDFSRGTIYLSEETHYCVPKAARIAGITAGAPSVTAMPSRVSSSSSEGAAAGLCPDPGRIDLA